MNELRRLTRLPDESLREGLARASQEAIMKTTLSEYELTPEQVQHKTRKSEIVMARHIISYLLSVNADMSFEAIGRVFRKDHCTAIHSRNVIEDLIETNRVLKLKIITISTKIRNQNEQS